MKRRPLATTAALFCVLVQLGLGVSSTLGLIFCVGDDHAGIAVASDDCCPTRGTAARPVLATADDDCCSDIPLYAASRPLSDVPRSHVAASVVAVTGYVATALVVPPPTGAAANACTAAPPHTVARATIVLRV